MTLLINQQDKKIAVQLLFIIIFNYGLKSQQALKSSLPIYLLRAQVK